MQTPAFLIITLMCGAYGWYCFTSGKRLLRTGTVRWFNRILFTRSNDPAVFWYYVVGTFVVALMASGLGLVSLGKMVWPWLAP